MRVVKWSLALLLVACSSQRDVDAGDAALRAHDLPKAEAAYRRALTKTPDLAEALAGLGWTYNLVGQRSAARDAFERCREVAAEHVNCLRGLASLEMAGGRYDAASRLLSRARALQPDDAGVESSTALLALVTGDLATAHERYERLVSRLPDEGEYRLGLGEVLLRRREAKAAMEEARRGVELADTPVRYQALLWQLYARAAVQASAGLEDASRCEETAPPIEAWLVAADEGLDRAAATGVDLPELPATRRLIERRRSILRDVCPAPAPRVNEGGTSP